MKSLADNVSTDDHNELIRIFAPFSAQATLEECHLLLLDVCDKLLSPVEYNLFVDAGRLIQVASASGEWGYPNVLCIHSCQFGVSLLDDRGFNLTEDIPKLTIPFLPKDMTDRCSALADFFSHLADKENSAEWVQKALKYQNSAFSETSPVANLSYDVASSGLTQRDLLKKVVQLLSTFVKKRYQWAYVKQALNSCENGAQDEKMSGM